MLKVIFFASKLTNLLKDKCSLIYQSLLTYTQKIYQPQLSVKEAEETALGDLSYFFEILYSYTATLNGDLKVCLFPLKSHYLSNEEVDFLPLKPNKETGFDLYNFGISDYFDYSKENNFTIYCNCASSLEYIEENLNFLPLEPNSDFLNLVINFHLSYDALYEDCQYDDELNFVISIEKTLLKQLSYEINLIFSEIDKFVQYDS